MTYTCTKTEDLRNKVKRFREEANKAFKDYDKTVDHSQPFNPFIESGDQDLQSIWHRLETAWRNAKNEYRQHRKSQWTDPETIYRRTWRDM